MKRRYRKHKKYNKFTNQRKNISKTQTNTGNEKNYEIPEKFIFSPTTCASSKKNKKAANNSSCNNDNKNSENIINKSDYNFINSILDKILNDDFIIFGIIAVLLIERLNLKKSGADNNVLREYDIMIAALIYIYF